MPKAVIKVQNAYSWLKTDDEDLHWKLWKCLRFREKNYWHSRLYKQKRWDGFREFYKKDTGRFLTGLLPEVEVALRVLKTDWKLQDERPGVRFLYDKIDASFFGGKIVPHDYQISFINNLLRPDGSLPHRGIVLAPTSAGKSLVMFGFAKTLAPNTPTLILGNKKQIAQQNYEGLLEQGIKNVGRVYDKFVDPNVFTCATVQSLHKLEKLLPHVKVLIVDEIHDMTSKLPLKYYNKMTSCSVRVGVSATPFKSGGTDKVQKYTVKGYFGPVIKTDSVAAVDGVLKTSKLQELGQLSKCECKFYPVTKPEGLEYAIYQDAVTQGIAHNFVFHRQVVDVARSMSGRTLIIVERLSQGDFLKQMMPEALWIQGKDDLDTRKYVIEQLKYGKGDIIALATVGIFNTGVSVYVMNLLNAAGGRSEHQVIQRFGRGLRVANDKDVLQYRDFYFKINPYLQKHSEERIRILQKEGHTVNILDS